MTALILDAGLEKRLIEERQAWGADKHDEVWEGVYVMAALPDDEHQEIAARLVRILDETLGDTAGARVRGGVNLAGLDVEDWKQDFRVPDVALFLRDTAAANRETHWRGPADFLVEITSPGDRTREKVPSYETLGVVELLIVDRHGWNLELYRHDGARLRLVGTSSPESGEALRSRSLDLAFQLVPAEGRPRIRVTHPASGRAWDV